jgi:hypothetical protein
VKRSDETLTDLRTRLDTSEQERRDAQRAIQLLTHEQVTDRRPNIGMVVAITSAVTVIVIVTIYAIKTNVISL